MKPDTETAPPTAELRKILQSASLDMLENFLTQYQAKRRSGSPQRPPGSEINAVSTALWLDVHSGFEFMKYCQLGRGYGVRETPGSRGEDYATVHAD